jgi:sugar/nucleoside kinase (ribokinase family)
MLDALRPDVPRLFDQAHRYGLSTSLDTNYDPTELWNGGLAETLARADIFMPNAAELQAITGRADVEAALETMAKQTPLIAVKLGRDGALARWGAEMIRAETLPVAVVDTTGAGDTFDAGFIYGYLANWELARALRLGCICGALSTRAAGGTAAQPTLVEALDVL